MDTHSPHCGHRCPGSSMHRSSPPLAHHTREEGVLARHICVLPDEPYPPSPVGEGAAAGGSQTQMPAGSVPPYQRAQHNHSLAGAACHDHCLGDRGVDGSCPWMRTRQVAGGALGEGES
ncbi:hypothetical protein FKM82_022603 [Ascaphus truei]